MGLFDIFNKKKKERERQEQSRLQQEAEAKRRADEQRRQTEARQRAEEQRKQQEETKRQAEEKRKQNEACLNNEQASNRPKRTPQIQVPNTSVLPTNATVSRQLQNLAHQVNLSFKTDNQQATIKLMSELFDTCYGRNGYKLLQISDVATPVVGLAFTSIARHLDFNDHDLNSVAAENALYCLARYLIATGNDFYTPAIFTLLFNHSDLLKDQLISAHCEIAQKDVGMPIGMMLGGNPYNAPHLYDFREQAISKRVPIMAYILPFFYNETSKKYYDPPTDLPYYPPFPSQSEINRFIRIKSEYEETNDSMLSEGERYFYQIFEKCQDTLLRTKST